MNTKQWFSAGLLAVTASTAQALPYGFFDARSVAMGNVSTATGGLQTAAFGNPAMMAVNEGDDTFALIIPAIGVSAIDKDDMIDKIDEFQSQPSTVSGAQRQLEILYDIEGSSVIVDATGNAAMIYSGDTYSIGVDFRAFGTASAGIVPGSVNPSIPDAQIKAFGYVGKELGLSIARKFSLLGMDLSIGVRPKTISLEAVDHTESVQTIDVTADNIRNWVEDLDSLNTVDAGLVLDVLDSLRVGFTASNLISDSFTTANGGKIDFDTHYRAGVAFDAGFLTLAADMDLNEIKPIGYEDPSRMMAVGLEIDTFNIVQLRAGYQTNLADGSNQPDLISAGVGLWLGFHIDLAVVKGGNSMGVFAQTGFRF